MQLLKDPTTVINTVIVHMQEVCCAHELEVLRRQLTCLQQEMAVLAMNHKCEEGDPVVVPHDCEEVRYQGERLFRQINLAQWELRKPLSQKNFCGYNSQDIEPHLIQVQTEAQLLCEAIGVPELRGVLAWSITL